MVSAIAILSRDGTTLPPEAKVFAPELGEGLPYALADFFNFSQQARQFHPIPAPAGAQHFLNDYSPPQDPDNDADDPD